MKTFLIRGVPVAMQQDGWWFNIAPTPTENEGEKSQFAPSSARAGLLVALIALGDVLVWQVTPGLSLAVFGVALVMAALWTTRASTNGRRQTFVAGGSILALLPLVEVVQPLSVLIAIVGVSAMLAFLAGLRRAEVFRGAMRLWPMGVRQTFVDAGQWVKAPKEGNVRGRVSRLLMGWLMPSVLGLIFVMLLLQANPIASGWADAIWSADVRLPEDVRVMFWICLIPLGWTVLSLGKMRERLRAAPRATLIGPRREGFINQASVTRALVMFNAVFALQTGMDAVYLYGGFGLPEGMSYAQYAHRGAYPLVATALLAGGFALMSRRWVEGNTLLRGLLMLWVAQNVALVVSSLVRLELYVAVYGLTYMRVAAAIWMGLVAGGLALIFAQVWSRKSNGWLMLRGGAMAGVVLYTCAWVNFDASIARFNLTSAERFSRDYLCMLGDGAKPVVAIFEQKKGKPICYFGFYRLDEPRDWREWGFRNWRVRTSLAKIQTEGRP